MASDDAPWPPGAIWRAMELLTAEPDPPAPVRIMAVCLACCRDPERFATPIDDGSSMAEHQRMAHGRMVADAG